MGSLRINEVEQEAQIGTLKVLRHEGSRNGELCWRCEDEQGRNVVLLESVIVTQYALPNLEIVNKEAHVEPPLEKTEQEPELAKKKSWFAKMCKKLLGG